MDIWILVITLMVIAIVLLIASFYVRDDHNIEEQIEELSIQQSEEIFSIKSRIAEIENELRNPVVSMPSNSSNEVYEEVEVVAEEEINLSEISDLTKEEVIRLYSQGFTMQEISNDIALNVQAVQLIVDDYIENR